MDKAKVQPPTRFNQKSKGMKEPINEDFADVTPNKTLLQSDNESSSAIISVDRSNVQKKSAASRSQSILDDKETMKSKHLSIS